MSRLADATWVDAGRGGTLVVPVGSIEQHGPHLPLGTDGMVAEELVRRLETNHPEIWVAPTIWVGASGEHRDFPGTLSIGTPALTTVLVELARSADHFDRVIAVNWHGGNGDALAEAERIASVEGRDLKIWRPDPARALSEAVNDRIPDLHAGWLETSIILSLRPDLVRMDEALPGRVELVSELVEAMRTSGVRAVSENGVLGDPAGSDPAVGACILDSLSSQLIEFYDGARDR